MIFTKVQAHAKNVRQEGTLRKYFNFPVRGVLPKEEDRNKFYRYYGSLTTPGCNEVVVWTVFKEKLEISSVVSVIDATQREYCTSFMSRLKHIKKQV